MSFARLPLPACARIVCIGLVLLAQACQSGKKAQRAADRPVRARTATISSGMADNDAGTPPSRTRFVPSPETQKAISRIRDASWSLFTQSMPPTRLSFFANNLGFIVKDAIEAVPLTAGHRQNPCRANRVELQAPRELVTMADQRLLAVGASSTFILDSNCESKVLLPKVSYLPGNHLLPDPRWPNAFSIYDPSSHRFSRFQWSKDALPSTKFFLPTSTLVDPNLGSGACALMRDGSLACVQGRELVHGWPGHPTRSLGTIAEGPACVRVLPADRVDHARVVRGEAWLEEYALVDTVPLVNRFPLPVLPFDLVAGSSYLAVLQITPATHGNAAEEYLVVLESDGKLRWSIPRGTLPPDLSEREWIRQHFECRGLTASPTRPWLAVSNCSQIDVFDARNGQLLQRIQRTAP